MTSIASQRYRSPRIIIFYRFGFSGCSRRHNTLCTIVFDSPVSPCDQVKSYRTAYAIHRSNSIFCHTVVSIGRTVFSYTILVHHGLCPFVGTPFL